MFRKYGLIAFLFLMAIFYCCLISTKEPYRLAFASDRAGNGDIFIVNQWGQQTNLTQSPTGDWNPRWSPNGRLLAFTSHRANQADIWLIAADGSRPINLTNHPAWDYSPAWSPDGVRLVFVSERDGDAELFIQATNSPTATQLTFNTHQDKLPSWSPQGDKIAFAAVANGIEQTYLLDLNNQNTITPLLDTGLNSTDPVWSPTGEQIAFIGWQDSNAINIYTFDLTTRHLQKRYTDTLWIGSLSWSPDGSWLFFTGRQDRNHDLMALNMSTQKVFKLTTHPAWDDFPALHPDSSFKPRSGQILNRPSNLSTGANDSLRSAAGSQFGYGVNLADLSNAYLIQDIHFTALKGYVNWATVEPQPGQYRWVDPDNVLHAAKGAKADVLLRVHGTPEWARPAGAPLSHPPGNLADFARFMKNLVSRYRGRVIAYEIWNEPNLNYEWGYRPPDPTEYTALLKTAYRTIKTYDPDALVISAGLAPTGEGNPPEAMGDLTFIEGMYQAGARGYFDALGAHLYAYGRPPDFDSPTDITFARVVQQRQLMINYNDAETPIWITEMGWSLETHWDLGEYHNQGISQLEQAQYLRRAYQKIEQEWPWIEAAYLFNLDFSAAPWYTASEQMRWYAILNPDRTPRPAYTALREYRTNLP
jgi:Tol biopolymer transport system component/GH35 family endo-1,4-beta-xylanase